MNKFFVMILLMLPVVSWADELDIYKGAPQNVPARIMLLLDTSLSMTQKMDNSDQLEREDLDRRPLEEVGTLLNCAVVANDERKFCVLKRTLSRFLGVHEEFRSDSVRWPDNLEVGLATYFSFGESDRASTIRAEVRRLGSDYVDEKKGTITYREHLQDLLDGLGLDTYTPLLGSYLDVLEYMHAGTALDRDSNHLVSVWADRTLGRYNRGMPLEKTCGVDNNHIVFLTDGLSRQEEVGATVFGGSTLYERTVQFARRNDAALDIGRCTSGISRTNAAIDQDEIDIIDCTKALARSIVSVDPISKKVSGIRTHVIAFSLEETIDEEDDSPAVIAEKKMINEAVGQLIAWAEAGQGNGVSVNNETGLTNAFGNIVAQAQQLETFTATVPGVGINQANRFTFLDDLYFSTFKPTDQAFWYGNLKKYKLGRALDAPVVQDSKGNNIDANNDGFIDDTVESFWFSSAENNGAAVDGDKVAYGGSAARIQTPDSRRLFTTLNGSIYRVTSGSDADITAMISSDSVKAGKVLSWMRGVDELGDTNEWKGLTEGTAKSVRTLYGAPIHSRPVVVNYKSTEDGKLLVGDDQSKQENLVFVSTNDGKLYVVDGSDSRADNGGMEKLAFVPEELLQRPESATRSVMEQLYDAARGDTVGSLIYGLDSSWTVWRQDYDKDGNITAEGESGDFVYLYGGMRRGGRNYYGLDMTGVNKDAPDMDRLFVLKGGQAGEFLNMGQTWSEPVLGLIKFNGRPMVVMIVGGGYDPVYDAGRRGDAVPMGAQIYIVAAHDSGTGAGAIEAGKVLWWASDNGSGVEHQDIDQLKHSIPSTVKPLDKDGDGYLDHFYVGDLGGQLLRFDINNENTGPSDLVSNTGSIVVAQLGVEGISSNLDENDRRFYFPPSIALMNDTTGQYVGIAIGSGLLTKPKDKQVNERFYFVRDYRAIKGATAPAPVVFSSDLNLEAEKLMGSPLIVNGGAYFSTYYWGDNAVSGSSQCTAQYGRAALYRYTPGESAITLIRKAYPQSLAGNIASLLQLVPGKDSDGELDPTKDRMDLVGLGGAGAFDLPDIDLGNIRKTRWKQCPVDSTACN